MDNGLAPLNAAVAARMAGRVVTASDLRFAAKYRWPHGLDLSTWATRGDSENHSVYAAAAFADWPFLAALARWWREHGLFGSEAGCDNRYYSSGVVEVMLFACRELLKAGALDEAEAIRAAVRAHYAWLALASVPTTRVRDHLVTGAGIVTGTRPAPRRGKAASLPGLSVAPAGNRFHGPASRAWGLTTDDAGSEILWAAIQSPQKYALTETESIYLLDAVRGVKASAQEVSSWLFRTLAGWRWTLRRLVPDANGEGGGAERVFWAGDRGPNPNKPARAVGQVLPDGTYRGLQPSPRNDPGWSAGWTVSEESGLYTASCAGGSASLPKLGGETLWTVEIENGEVKFS
jgi:hypothetical protein